MFARFPRIAFVWLSLLSQRHKDKRCCAYCGVDVAVSANVASTMTVRVVVEVRPFWSVAT